jgi:hypothetical protein
MGDHPRRAARAKPLRHAARLACRVVDVSPLAHARTGHRWPACRALAPESQRAPMLRARGRCRVGSRSHRRSAAPRHPRRRARWAVQGRVEPRGERWRLVPIHDSLAGRNRSVHRSSSRWCGIWQGSGLTMHKPSRQNHGSRNDVNPRTSPPALGRASVKRTAVPRASARGLEKNWREEMRPVLSR